MTIWYILYPFGTFFPVLVSCTKKNLATLVLAIPDGLFCSAKADFDLTQFCAPFDRMQIR
jgi:hypothetical protein